MQKSSIALAVCLACAAGAASALEAGNVIVRGGLAQVSPDVSDHTGLKIDVDSNTQLGLTAEDFEWVTRKLVELADRVCGGRVVSALEGGYDATGLAEGCAAHLTALMRG